MGGEAKGVVERAVEFKELALVVGNWRAGFGRGSGGLTSSLNLKYLVGLLLLPPSLCFFTNKALEALYFFKRLKLQSLNSTTFS